MAARKSGALKYVSATKRISKPASKKTTRTKSIKTRKADVNVEKQVVSSKVVTKAKTDKSTKATEEVDKVKIHKPNKPEISWFAIAKQGGQCKVVNVGTQLECIQYMAQYVEANGEANTPMFLAKGFMVLGY